MRGPCCAIFPQHQGMRRRARLLRGRGAPRRRSAGGALDAAFAGDFDNYAQVAAELARGIAAADRAGYEHVHCCLRPLRAAAARRRRRGAGRPRVLLPRRRPGERLPAAVLRVRRRAAHGAAAAAAGRARRRARASPDLPARGAAARACGDRPLEPRGRRAVAWRPVDGGFDGAMAGPVAASAEPTRWYDPGPRQDARAPPTAYRVDDRGYALGGTLSPARRRAPPAPRQGTHDQGGDPYRS